MKGKFIAVIAACAILCMAGAFASCNHEHKFGEWVTVTEATCTKGGVRERTCRCGEREAEAIDALGHDYQNGVCTRCGEEQPPTDNAFFAFLSQGNGCYSIKAAPGKLLPETVVLPSEYEGGAVTEILPSGFWRGNMRTVFIPDSYTNIANEAFSGCDALEEVTAEVTENVQLRSLKNVMRNLHLTAEQALAALEIFGPERETLIRKLQ